MPQSLDERMEEAMSFFTNASCHALRESDQTLFTHLKAMAAGIQESRRVLDYLQTQIEKIHHEVGSR
jgi:hypothetical protein